MTTHVAEHFPYAEIVRTLPVDKPWGSEVIFATGENAYVGKLITVLAGHSLSLQYHEHKDEKGGGGDEQDDDGPDQAKHGRQQ